MDLFFGTLLATLLILLLASPLLYEVYKLKDRKPKTSPHGSYPFSKVGRKTTFLRRR